MKFYRFFHLYLVDFNSKMLISKVAGKNELISCIYIFALRNTITERVKTLFAHCMKIETLKEIKIYVKQGCKAI